MVLKSYVSDRLPPTARRGPPVSVDVEASKRKKKKTVYITVVVGFIYFI